MSLEQAAEASVIDPETEFKISSRLIDPHLISDPCSSLVIVNRNKYGSKVIKFAHPSVQRYLCSKQLRESETPVSQFAISDVDANALIFKSYSRYFQHLSWPVGGTCSPTNFLDYPLHVNAILDWPYHYAKIPQQLRHDLIDDWIRERCPSFNKKIIDEMIKSVFSRSIPLDSDTESNSSSVEVSRPHSI